MQQTLKIKIFNIIAIVGRLETRKLESIALKATEQAARSPFGQRVISRRC